ncbi:MAG: hypothetical protein ACRDD1_07080 [Planctomycetia bacterium]
MNSSSRSLRWFHGFAVALATPVEMLLHVHHGQRSLGGGPLAPVFVYGTVGLELLFLKAASLAFDPRLPPETVPDFRASAAFLYYATVGASGGGVFAQDFHVFEDYERVPCLVLLYGLPVLSLLFWLLTRSVILRHRRSTDLGTPLSSYLLPAAAPDLIVKGVVQPLVLLVFVAAAALFFAVAAVAAALRYLLEHLDRVGAALDVLDAKVEGKLLRKVVDRMTGDAAAEQPATVEGAQEVVAVPGLPQIFRGLSPELQTLLSGMPPAEPASTPVSIASVSAPVPPPLPPLVPPPLPAADAPLRASLINFVRLASDDPKPVWKLLVRCPYCRGEGSFKVRTTKLEAKTAECIHCGRTFLFPPTADPRG